MGDWILNADEVRTARNQIENPRTYGLLDEHRAMALCNTVDELRACQERAEEALREAATSYHYAPRGIGKGCFPCVVCSEKDPRICCDDMAAFVRTREDGEAVVALFEKMGCRATLDWRPTEPNWVQVKIGSCSEHERFLPALAELAARTETINAAMIRVALAAALGAAGERGEDG